jgi:fructose-specific phosphotransferase system IIA component
MKISKILHQDKILAELKGNSKEEVINELVDLFVSDNRVTNVEEIRKAVFEREKIMSTGIGSGFAIPHAKSDAVKEMVAAFGKSAHPVDFNSNDNQPVNLVFLFVSNNRLVGDHIKLLSRISKMMEKSEFRAKLMNTNSSEQIYFLFQTEENNLLT